MNSHALKSSHSRYGTYLLCQAFPEGSPTHPAYPTGHGTVAGACITVLKFFFDCDQPFASLSAPVLRPYPDGLSLGYNEKINIKLKGLDGSPHTISN